MTSVLLIMFVQIEELENELDEQSLLQASVSSVAHHNVVGNARIVIAMCCLCCCWYNLFYVHTHVLVI